MNELRTIQPAAIHDAATALLTDLCSISSESGNAVFAEAQFDDSTDAMIDETLAERL